MSKFFCMNLFPSSSESYDFFTFDRSILISFILSYSFFHCSPFSTNWCTNNLVLLFLSSVLINSESYIKLSRVNCGSYFTTLTRSDSPPSPDFTSSISLYSFTGESISSLSLSTTRLDLNCGTNLILLS